MIRRSAASLSSISSNQDETKPLCDCETVYSLSECYSSSQTSLPPFYHCCRHLPSSGTRSFLNRHPQSRVQGAEMEQKSDFCGGRYPLLVCIQTLDGNTLCAALLKPLFIPLRRGRRVRTPHDVDIPIRLRVAIPQGPISTNAHTSETFQRPSKLTCRDTIGSKILSPTVRSSKS